MPISIADFAAVDIRAGTILRASIHPSSRTPAYLLTIDFGPDIGERSSSAQLTRRYRADDLVGRQIIGVVNLPPKRIAGFVSAALVLGLPDESGGVVLVTPAEPVANGSRLY